MKKLFLFYTHRLKESIADLKSKMDQQNQEYARLTVAKDVELETLHQHEAKMRSELAQRKDDLERCEGALNITLFSRFVLIPELTELARGEMPILHGYCMYIPVKTREQME